VTGKATARTRLKLSVSNSVSVRVNVQLYFLPKAASNNSVSAKDSPTVTKPPGRTLIAEDEKEVDPSIH
jgi:hypothetical protein